MDELRQRVDVCPLQLHERAPFQDQPGQVVGQGELFENVNRCGGDLRLAGTLGGRQLQLVEENGGELLGRVDIEFFAGQLEDLRASVCQLGFDTLRLTGQRRQIDAHTAALDVGQ